MCIQTILRQGEGRYPTRAEFEQALEFARTLPQRVAAAEEIEANEESVVNATCAAVRERYPRFGRVHAQAWERLDHDLRLILRYDVRALLGDDPRALENKALLYLRSIWAAYHVTPQFAGQACELLREEVRGKLSDGAFAVLEPYLTRNQRVLGDLPEPAVAAV